MRKSVRKQYEQYSTEGLGRCLESVRDQANEAFSIGDKDTGEALKDQVAIIKDILLTRQ